MARTSSINGKVSATVPCRTASRIPRPLREQVEQCLQLRFAYMPCSVFKEKNIQQRLFDYDKEPALPSTGWYQPTREEMLNLAIAGAPQLMSAEEEKLMFLRFNYAKLKLTQLQAEIARRGLTRASGEELLEWNRRFEYFREYLVRTNLALVLAMARRMRLGDVDFAEIVSEGNMALIRAVDKFNVERGFKFSTYACRAIMKAFSRISLSANRHRTRFPMEFEPNLERSDWAERRREQIEADCVEELKVIIDGNLADLSKVEQTVIRSRFNWQEAGERPLTLDEVGRVVGLTKERVRQIQVRAISKIKTRMQDTVLRTKTLAANDQKTGADLSLSAADVSWSAISAQA